MVLERMGNWVSQSPIFPTTPPQRVKICLSVTILVTSGDNPTIEKTAKDATQALIRAARKELINAAGKDSCEKAGHILSAKVRWLHPTVDAYSLVGGTNARTARGILDAKTPISYL
eukprot:COSAG02_NODE_3692_length_6376_cov_17.973395_4_plen_116_part_00